MQLSIFSTCHRRLFCPPGCTSHPVRHRPHIAPSDLSQQLPVPRCQSNKLIWYQNTYLGDLLPDQPQICRRGKRTTYILFPNPPRTRCFRHPHLALQEFCLGNSLSRHLVLQSLFLSPPCLSFHIPPLLLPSFSLSLHFHLTLSLFLHLALHLFSCFLFPPHLFCPTLPKLSDLPLIMSKLHLKVIFQ